MINIAIIGGGIGGLCTAIGLQRKGFKVKVYENASVLKPVGAGIVLAANAMYALHRIGVGKDILPAGKILGSIALLGQGGRILTQAAPKNLSSKIGTDSFSIHRADLHEILQRHLVPETLELGKSCSGFQQDSEGVTISFKDGSVARADYLIAADGIHSVIRKKLLPDSLPRYAGYTCWRAVIEKGPEGFDYSNFSETWGKDGRFGIAPLTGTKVYWFACINSGPMNPEMAKMKVADLKDVFQEYHFPIPQLLALTKERDMIWNDIIDIKPIKQFAFDRVVLIGDAAHATTPNMGQGACQAIEDSVVLTDCLATHQNPLDAFKQFEKKRIARTTKIVNTSWSIGKIAQLNNPLLIKARNTMMRLVPPSVNEKQVSFLFDVDF